MPRLTVLTDDGPRELKFSAGPSLRDLLNATDLRVRSACRGNGACGLCRVRVEAGEGGPPNVAEALHLNGDQLAAGERLGCQVYPQGDMVVRPLALAPPSVWRSLPDADYRSIFPPTPRQAGSRRFGVAIDLGTTHISLALCDLRNGRRLAMRFGPNPQAIYGSDILNRLEAAAEDPAAARRLQRSVVDAIGEGLVDISSRDGLSLHDVAEVAIVGNTAILALLAGNDPRPLLDPAHWSAPFACRVEEGESLCNAWNLLPATPVELIQPLAGFVGSDLAVGLVHGRATQWGGPTLFVDFGTNSEMALWDGERFHVTSAAGGPAFEGMGIGCGMAAEPGAIYRVQSDGRGGWSYEVVGGLAPTGLCAPALVDLLARLVAMGVLNEKGQFRDPAEGSFRLPLTPFRVDKRDVDVLQQAKAAIAAGFESLLEQAGLEAKDLAAVLIGGAFGRYLDPVSAIAIGLLPALPPERVQLLGNSSLNGCQDWLVSGLARQALADLRERCAVTVLSQRETFEDMFFAHLYLRPFPLEAPAETAAAAGQEGCGLDSPAACFTAFTHATQYLAALLPDADLNQEAVAIATRIFKADCAAMYALRDGEAQLAYCSHPNVLAAIGDELAATLGQVLESGFLSIDQYRLGIGTASFICLPITQHGELTAILALGFAGVDRPARELLDALLGIAGLVGATFTHQAAKALTVRYAEELEAQVRQRTAALEQANKELEAFSYSISHDLRAPLRAIDGFALILAEDYAGRLDEDGRRHIDTIRRSTIRMGDLIDDILEFSRMSRRELILTPVDMSSLVREAFEEVHGAVPQRKILLRMGNLPPARGDRALIRQVLVNLLANAVKFTASRSEAVIEVDGVVEGEEVAYRVKDNGVGFDMQYADRLFGVFQRLHAASDFEGTGIGLAIVKRIVVRHGGRIWAEGKVGEGATLHFTLPRG